MGCGVAQLAGRSGSRPGSGAGYCFGHQIIAHALGGRADRKGAWGVGRMPAETFGLPFEQANLLVSHQDQVMELPPGLTE